MQQPSQQIIEQLLGMGVFSNADVLQFANISPQRLQQWLNRSIVHSMKKPDGSGRRVFNVAQLMGIAVIARLTDAYQIPVSTAAWIGKIAVNAIVREWRQAAYWHDVRQSPGPGEILSNMQQHGYTYYVRPNPFLLKETLERLESDVLCIPPDLSGIPVTDDPPEVTAHMGRMAFGVDPSVSVSELLKEHGSPLLVIDLAPICRTVLAPALKCSHREL